jgi:GxxExxY protein
MEKQILFAEESFAINGAVFEVHKVLGTGFHEKVYQDALEREFQLRGIPYVRETQLKVFYKGEPLAHCFFADFLCYDKIVVELKSSVEMEGKFLAQTINYLKATGFELGLLINFQQDVVKPLRIPNLSGYK